MSHHKYRAGTRALAALLAATAVAGCERDEPLPPAPRPDATVTVQTGDVVQTRGSMNGLLHSLSATEPRDALVAPLAPRLWRSDLTRASPERARALGARYLVVLSDLWGYPKDGWNGRGPPWANLRRWERFVRATARAQRGRPLMWDVWNEPDVRDFWRGGRRRLISTYVVAARALREELGAGVLIGGPSISRYSLGYLRDLLDACVRGRCRVSFVSWHENLQADQPIAAGADRLAQARSALLGDPRYRRVGLREIFVTEYVGLEDRFFPGEAVAYLDALERGGADLAARSCWAPADCTPAGVGGLVDSRTGRRRAVWWPHAWYAEGLAGRVRSYSDDRSITALARAIPGRVEVLLGHAPLRGPGAPAARNVRVGLALKGLGRALGTQSRARVTVERVPASGERGIDGPDRLREESVTLDGRSLRLVLPILHPHEAMRVVLRFQSAA